MIEKICPNIYNEPRPHTEFYALSSGEGEIHFEKQKSTSSKTTLSDKDP